MIGILRKIVLVLAGLSFIAAPTLTEPVPVADLDEIEGKWSGVDNTDSELYLTVMHKRECGQVIGSIVKLKIGSKEGYVEYMGAAKFEAKPEMSCLVLRPGNPQVVGLPESIAYSFNKVGLALQVDKGTYKGAYTFQRIK